MANSNEIPTENPGFWTAANWMKPNIHNTLLLSIFDETVRVRLKLRSTPEMVMRQQKSKIFIIVEAVYDCRDRNSDNKFEVWIATSSRKCLQATAITINNRK